MIATALKLLGRDDLIKKDVEPLPVRSIVDLCRAACDLQGITVPSDRHDMIRAAASTGTLPLALGAAGEKIALDAYQQAPATWRSFARVVSAASFRDHTGVRLAAAVQLDELSSDGEIRHGTLDEETVTYRVTTYAKMLSLTREMIVNDDLSILGEIPAAFGRAAARKVSDLIYTVLLGNANNFFSAGNGNLLTGAGSALSADSLGDALQALRNQTDADGMPLDLVPKVLLVPPALEADARALLASRELNRTGDKDPTGNPFST
ncbi:MAG TPA: hypothetical protein EYP14_16045, partial [Planctomycetaceae bacterium]|nr:hypothetical protein [Planctomycetaceae bacterium]